MNPFLPHEACHSLVASLLFLPSTGLSLSADFLSPILFFCPHWGCCFRIIPIAHALVNNCMISGCRVMCPNTIWCNRSKRWEKTRQNVTLKNPRARQPLKFIKSWCNGSKRCQKTRQNVVLKNPIARQLRKLIKSWCNASKRCQKTRQNVVLKKPIARQLRKLIKS